MVEALREQRQGTAYYRRLNHQPVEHVRRKWPIIPPDAIQPAPLVRKKRRRRGWETWAEADRGKREKKFDDSFVPGLIDLVGPLTRQNMTFPGPQG